MTILPKKKPSKDKNNDSDSSDHKPHSHHQSSEGRGGHSRSRNSPQWMPPTSRDGEVLSPHDPGGSTSHDVGSAHNKRRHRTTARKHRSERACTSSMQVAGSSPHSPSDSVSGYNSGDEYDMPNFKAMPTTTTDIDELERWFEHTLKEKKGMVIKQMGQDGACLFRAVADQIYGDQEMHGVVRKQCLDYMAKNADYFKQYITEDFNTYLSRKRMDHCHGNHVEMQAIGEMYNRCVEVYQYSIEPINTFHGSYKTDNAPIRISYHGGVHYNSIVHPWKATIGVGLGLPGLQPGAADKSLVNDAMRLSEDHHIETTMMEDKLRETDWEVTQDTIQEQVARESYLQWLRDQEKLAKTRASTKSASATCSSSCDPNINLNSPRPLSGHSSPLRSDSQDSNDLLPIPGVLLNERSPKPSPKPLSVAVSTASSAGASFCETSSLMDFSPALYGLENWDEQDLLARVMAESHREYLESLKKQSSPTPNPTQKSNRGREFLLGGSSSLFPEYFAQKPDAGLKLPDFSPTYSLSVQTTSSQISGSFTPPVVVTSVTSASIRNSNLCLDGGSVFSASNLNNDGDELGFDSADSKPS